MDASEDVVQEILIKLWNNRETISFDKSQQSYLYRAVRNGCLNVLKHVDIREEYKLANERNILLEEASFTDETIVSELEMKIRLAIDQLPMERRRVFILSRYDGLKYKEIAEHLNISQKTVENQMGKALKFLRTELREYLPLLLFYFNDFFKN